MDGLLLDTERLFMEALVDLVVPMGLDAEAARHFFFGLVGTSAQKTSAALRSFLPDHIDHLAFEAAWRARNAEKRAGTVPLMPHVGDALPVLAADGHRMAVVTSTKRAPALAHLEQAGLLGYFEIVVAGDDVTANKPDPAPYLQAAQALGVDPVRCAAFEDSDTGTTAAHRAGCHITQIPDLRPQGKPLPDLGQTVAPDLGQALANHGLWSVAAAP